MAHFLSATLWVWAETLHYEWLWLVCKFALFCPVSNSQGSSVFARPKPSKPTRILFGHPRLELSRDSKLRLYDE